MMFSCYCLCRGFGNSYKDNTDFDICLYSNSGNHTYIGNKASADNFVKMIDDRYKDVVEEEKNAQCPLCDDKRNDNLADGMYIYEPNAAILKAGAYKLIGTRYGLKKLGSNTHLYVSKEYVAEFPGRIWKLRGEFAKERQILHASVMTRNYPLSADQLRKKLKIKEGEQLTVIGARLGEKPVVMLAEKC
jgi:hypothetical protein